MMAPLHLLTSVATVTRHTLTYDSGGVPIETFGPHLTDLPCRVNCTNGREAMLLGRSWSQTDRKIYFAGKPDIETHDRITVDGETYVITAVTDYDNQGFMTECVCERAQA
jgi:SPP1 family predicted phage head-tail adaptor